MFHKDGFPRNGLLRFVGAKWGSRQLFDISQGNYGLIMKSLIKFPLDIKLLIKILIKPKSDIDH